VWMLVLDHRWANRHPRLDAATAPAPGREPGAHDEAHGFVGGVVKLASPQAGGF
jgi:hypothetical protein